ncbi:hypothetical protein ACLOJK_033244 [Asimina triloba]
MSEVLALKWAPLGIEMVVNGIWSCSNGVVKRTVEEVDVGGAIGGTDIDVDSNCMRMRAS